jgi:4-nitrophenyl phosphatase
MNPALHPEGSDLGLAGLNEVNGLVIDMDGVLWRGDEPIPGLERFIRSLRQQKIRFVLATNNNTKTPTGFAEKAVALGAQVLPEEILTATTATIHYLHKHYPRGTPLYAIGEKALKDQLETAGYILAERGVAAVVVALDRNLTYEMLKRATFLINAGAAFIGVNPDVVYPTPEGLAPGSGMVLAALHATTGCSPVIIGKPEIGMFQIALERMGLPAAQCASLGDRLDTDIAGAQRAGLKSILVLSGVTTPETLAACPIQPDWVFPSILELTDALKR